MLSLLRQNPLEQRPRGRVLLAEVTEHVPVRLDGNALGDPFGWTVARRRKDPYRTFRSSSNSMGGT
jgi:hypothetical protein